MVTVSASFYALHIVINWATHCTDWLTASKPKTYPSEKRKVLLDDQQGGPTFRLYLWPGWLLAAWARGQCHRARAAPGRLSNHAWKGGAVTPAVCWGWEGRRGWGRRVTSSARARGHGQLNVKNSTCVQDAMNQCCFILPRTLGCSPPAYYQLPSRGRPLSVIVL